MRQALLAGLLAVVQAAGTAGSGQNAPPGAGSSPLGAISGVVIDSVTNRPVKGAVVTLGPAVLIGTGTRQATDERGRFIFIGLPAADNYTLQAEKPGYLDRGNLQRPRQFALAAGQWLADNTIRIIPEGSISGAVTDERGEPMAGVRVRLLALLPIAGRVRPAGGPVATTDDRGGYRFAGLPEGQYVTVVPSVQQTVPADTPPAAIAGWAVARASPTATGAVARGRARPALDSAGHRLLIGSFATPPAPGAGEGPRAYPITFHPQARTLVESAPVSLTPGLARGGVDIRLIPVPTWQVSGRVTGPATSPGGLPLRLLLADSDDLGLGSEAATTLVAADGRFTFLGVPAGRYVVDLRPFLAANGFSPDGLLRSGGESLPPTPGLSYGGQGSFVARIDAAPPGSEYSFRGGGWDQSVWAQVAIEVTDRHVTDVSVPLHRLGRLSGRVVWERTTDAPIPSPPPPRAPGAPLSVQDGIRQIIVSAQPADGTLQLGQPRAVMSDDGTFTIQGLLAGQYVLRVRPPLGVTSSVKSIVWNGADYAHAAIDVADTAEISDVVITLVDRAQSVTGIVAGVPVSDDGASVIAFPVDATRWTGYGLQPVLIRSVMVSGGGRYRVALPAGDFYLVAVDGSQSKAWIDPAFLRAASRAATRVTLALGEEKALDLRLTEVVK